MQFLWARDYLVCTCLVTSGPQVKFYHVGPVPNRPRSFVVVAVPPLRAHTHIKSLPHARSPSTVEDVIFVVPCPSEIVPLVEIMAVTSVRHRQTERPITKKLYRSSSGKLWGEDATRLLETKEPGGGAAKRIKVEFYYYCYSTGATFKN